MSIGHLDCMQMMDRGGARHYPAVKSYCSANALLTSILLLLTRKSLLSGLTQAMNDNQLTERDNTLKVTFKLALILNEPLAAFLVNFDLNILHSFQYDIGQVYNLKELDFEMSLACKFFKLFHFQRPFIGFS